MEELIGIAFEQGMILAGTFSIVAFLIGCLMNLFNNFGRG